MNGDVYCCILATSNYATRLFCVITRSSTLATANAANRKKSNSKSEMKPYILYINKAIEIINGPDNNFTDIYVFVYFQFKLWIEL